MKKVISALLIVLLICMTTTVAYATDEKKDGTDISYITGKKYTPEAGVYDSVDGFRSNAIGVIQAVGVSIAIIMLVYVGIKYMSSAPEERAELKKSLVIYVVGAVLIFASAGILSVIRTFIINNFNK